MANNALIYFGTESPVAEQRVLTAGPVTATLEAGALRWIRVGNREVIRGIAFVVRDRAWGTPLPEIRDLSIRERAGGFKVAFTALCRTAHGDLAWRGEITGRRDGTIRFVGTCTPGQDFLTGRTGFVILHPLDGFVGKAVEVEHVDGSTERTVVPETIDPAQPFFLIRAMTHRPIPGVKATVRMQGDSWETEDQRNWTDASFKTYSRPLALPWPYTLEKGRTIRQTATFTVSGRLPRRPPREGAPVAITLGRAQGAMPRIGLSVLPEDAERAADAADAVKTTGISHLNCRVDVCDAGWKQPLASYRMLAERARAAIVFEIIIPGVEAPLAELKPVGDAVKAAGIKTRAVMVTPAADLKSYPPGTPVPEGVPGWREIAAAVRKVFPRARIGGGMLSNFTELNRKRPPKGLFDYITHATSGLVHAADDRSVMETLETLPNIIASTKRIAGRAPCRIGPSHIGNSFNPYGADTAPNPDGGRVTMARVDPRHRGLFGAAWHLGYLSRVADGGLEAATMASPVGEFGIAYRKADHPQPLYDDDPEAAVYPVFHVLKGLASAAGARRVPAQSSEPGRVLAVAWRKGRTTSLWLANLRAEPIAVKLPPAAAGGTIATLDETTFGQAIRDLRFGTRGEALSTPRVTLLPYAVAHVRFGA